MTDEEKLYTMALTQLGYIAPDNMLRLIQEAGNGKAIFEQRFNIEELLPETTPRLKQLIAKDWSDALALAEKEIIFCQQSGIETLFYGDSRYPQRLNECPDAPVVLYYKGAAELNRQHIVSIVGTRHCSAIGIDAVKSFVSDLKRLCPDTLIVSGLAYGIDIHAHTQALDNGLDTVAVLAHGLNEIYPRSHYTAATNITRQGGLLTEYMSHSGIERQHFIQRNRIVAGITDACVVVESAKSGGSLITARISQEYNREVFAFPGRFTDKYSEGCNNLIRDNRATLITDAEQFLTDMGWQMDVTLTKEKDKGIEIDLFPEITDEQRVIIDALERYGDLQKNILIIKTGYDISKLSQLLFDLEMNGCISQLAGGSYHLVGKGY